MATNVAYLPGVNAAPQSLGPWGPGLVAAVNGATRALNNPISAQIPGGAINVMAFPYNAKGDGVTDDTSAIQGALTAAQAAGGIIYVPEGNYLCQPLTISGSINFSIKGAGRESSVFLLSKTGVLLTIGGVNFSTIEDVGFKLNGTAQGIASTQGVVVNNGAGNVVFSRCDFIGFAEEGLLLNGTSGNQMSGNEVLFCNFLGNGGAQLHSIYSNDFKIEGNQYGSLPAVTHATFGCLLENSGAGSYGPNNFHWSNVIGFKALNCSFNTYFGNRIEINDQQGAYLDTDTDSLFTHNKIFSNSQTGNSQYSNVYCDGTTGLQFENNKIFTWDTTNSKWGLELVNTNTDMRVHGNQVDGYDATGHGPYFVSAATAAANFTPDRFVSCSTAGSMAAGDDKYIGCNAQQTFSVDTAVFLGAKYQFVSCVILNSTAPGSGKTFTFTIDKSNTDTSAATTITGASAFEGTINHTTPPDLFNNTDYVALHTVFGAGSASSGIRYAMAFLEY